MQSIIKNAFDKVSVIKDVVGNSIEEAVKNNSKDAVNVFNSGSLLSSSIVNWAEKNNVSERANNIKASATMLVEDLATGIKGMTNNISIQNNNKEKTNKTQAFRQSNEFDYYNEPNLVPKFSTTHDNCNTLFSKYETSNSCSDKLMDTVNTKKKREIDHRTNIPILDNENSVDLLIMHCIDNKNMNEEQIGLFDTELTNELSSCEEIGEFVESNTETDKIVHMDSKCQETDSTPISHWEEGIDHLEKNEFLNSEPIKILEVAENDKFVMQSEVSDGLIGIIESSTTKSTTTLDNFSENSAEPEVKLKNNLKMKPENNTKENNIKLNPLSVFQQINKLENKNNSLICELEQTKNELSTLKEKLKIKENILEKINDKNSKLESENSSLSNHIRTLEEVQTQLNSKIVELKYLETNIGTIESAKEEQYDLIKTLQEKIVELENILSVEEASKIESLKAYQYEVSELKSKLSSCKDKETDISKPYISRISILEHQLTELRSRHSGEIQRFNKIIDNLKEQWLNDKSENETLKTKLLEVENSHREATETYNHRISQFRGIIEHLENNNASKATDASQKLNGRDLKLVTCSNITDVQIIETNNNVNNNYQKMLPYLNTNVISQIYKLNQKSSLDSLHEDFKQVVYEKQLLEDEYLDICEKRKQIEQELTEERKRNKLLQQQLENMFKPMNDLTEKQGPIK
ncbi:interaptin, possible [Cryptosporidium felis]|nr:interaptin, possible [Cryptosporidium felis]